MSCEPAHSDEQQCPVDRCVCFDQTFESIQSWCRINDATNVDAVRDHFGCGRGCGLCVPYLNEMLRTGRVRFAVMSADQTMTLVFPPSRTHASVQSSTSRGLK